MKKRRKEPETLREHCRHIFGDEPPVLCVWETEFDYADAELKALAAKEWQQISEWDLSAYYVLNLVYNEPMQIELFRYLFPLCLAQWHETVLAGGYGESLRRILNEGIVSALSLAGDDECFPTPAGTAIFTGHRVAAYG